MNMKSQTKKKPTQQTTTVERFNVGDRVVFKNFRMNHNIVSDRLLHKGGRSDSGCMVVDQVRIMFAKNEDTGEWLKAYTVKFPNGDREEYDETQLVNVEAQLVSVGEC
tara:strand:+ start:30 stop:353 length:324 start_codon:yes stop_codon:yes gene_type:complete